MIKKSQDKKLDSKDLVEALDEIKERFGEGAIMKLKDIRAVDVDVIPTGSISLDLALGVGGVPRGRVIEIFGPESSGKTTLSLHILAEAQKRGGVGAFIDAEHALDPDYAKMIGVKVDDILISQPDSGEQAMQIVEALVRSGNVDVIVIDSVAALTPKVEIEGEIGDQHIGLQARLMSQACRKLASIVSKTKTIVVFLNQTRMKIGVYFGNPETTPGGLALKFYASVRIHLQRTAQIKSGDEIIGNRVKAKIVKNKVAAPFRVAEFDIYYNEGISLAADLVRAGLVKGVIKQTGNTYQFGQKKIGVGLEAAKKSLRENPELMKEIKTAVLKEEKE
ncbi:recombinase RecA [Patescibacteria group bacterium]|nr:recombinase RecA [Patescibacteria group bacterium]MBU4275059.1 recombinase RecA [Patescibacteria group bacterium]MBU4367492.1 recombinase RecA [Patescibacteria group bacterium]MBU4462019.1 recombinase RecA [Patescibacteria group bacterium]MCG2700484.1 recombinase RecA [Candidatus Parcubacteria bacterium]